MKLESKSIIAGSLDFAEDGEAREDELLERDERRLAESPHRSSAFGQWNVAGFQRSRSISDSASDASP